MGEVEDDERNYGLDYSLPIYDLQAISYFGGVWVDSHPITPKAVTTQSQTFQALVYLPPADQGSK